MEDAGALARTLVADYDGYGVGLLMSATFFVISWLITDGERGRVLSWMHDPDEGPDTHLAQESADAEADEARLAVAFSQVDRLAAERASRSPAPV